MSATEALDVYVAAESKASRVFADYQRLQASEASVQVAAALSTRALADLRAAIDLLESEVGR